MSPRPGGPPSRSGRVATSPLGRSHRARHQGSVFRERLIQLGAVAPQMPVGQRGSTTSKATEPDTRRCRRSISAWPIFPSKDRTGCAGQVVRWPCRFAEEGAGVAPLVASASLRIAHRRREVDEVLTTVLRPTRAKRVPQEGELLRILPRPVVFLAVDDVRLLRILRLARSVRQDRCAFRLRPTVRDDIIRVPLERNVRVVDRIQSSNARCKKMLARSGLATPPWGVPIVRGTRVPFSCCMGAVSHRCT